VKIFVAGCFLYDYSFPSKGKGHEMDCNFVDIQYLGIKKRITASFKNFQIFQNIFIFLAVSVNSSPLDYVISVSLDKILFLLIGQGSRLLLSICWKN
jgi:hypothetical protein